VGQALCRDADAAVRDADLYPSLTLAVVDDILARIPIQRSSQLYCKALVIRF
jgi:hypothetical protein